MRLNSVSACIVFCCCVLTNTANANKITVDVITAQQSQDQQIVELTATVEAVQNAQLAAQQSGLVAEIYVDAGDQVAQGTLLLQLDDTLAKLNLTQANASVKAAQVASTEAQRLYEEVLALSKQKVVAQTLIDQRRANAEVASAELAKQRANYSMLQQLVKRHQVKAPFAGVIASRNVDLGEWVTPSSELFRLIDQDALRLTMAVPQQHFPLLRDARNVDVKVTSDITPTNALALKLSRLVPASTNKSRTMTAFVDLPADSGFIAGSSAQVELVLPHAAQSLVWLPKSALKQHPDGGASVFVVQQNQAKRVIVQVIEQNEAQVAVAGIQAGQSVVTSGIEMLRTGLALQVNSSADSQ